MTFWNVFLGVFAGIVAGIIINIAIEEIRNYKISRRMKRNLKFEIEFNIIKINSFLADLKGYREHINGDSPYEYFETLNFSGLLKTTLQQMFSDRSVYKVFNIDNIGKLQTFMADFQPDTVASINDPIKEIRQIKDLEKMRRVSNKYFDYLEGGLKAAKINLEMVRAKGDKD